MKIYSVHVLPMAAAIFAALWSAHTQVGEACQGEPVEAADSRREPVVDVARFAHVRSWDPLVMQGTTASRSDEMPAADLAPFREVLPSADGGYTVPMVGGMGSIGLEWDENRLLRHVELQFPSEVAMPRGASVQLQYWTGESAWQGKWTPALRAPETETDRLVWHLGDEELVSGTQKVRWVFSGISEPVVLKRISAVTRSRWTIVDLRIETAGPDQVPRVVIEPYNGVLLDPPQGSAFRCTWDGVQPLALKVLAAAAEAYKADRTVLRLQMAGTAFGIAVEDLLTHDCVYVPHANVFVTRQPSPVTPDEYLQRIAVQKSTLEEVRDRPDQDFGHACAMIHNPIQDRHAWAPTMLSLACDNRKFLVYREGSIVFNEYVQPDDYPGASDGVHTIAANINQWRFVPRLGSGQPLQVTRHLRGGWLPMPVTVAQDGNITYQQTTLVAPVGAAPSGKPVWLRERAVGVVEYRVTNTGTVPGDVRLAFQFIPEQDPQNSAEYRRVAEGVLVTSGHRVLALIDSRRSGPLSCQADATGVVLSGVLPAGSDHTCTVVLPAWQLAPDGYATLLFNQSWTSQVEGYWNSLLEPAMQVEIPDEVLNNLIPASQVHCMLAARNQDQSRYVVPWISSIHFGYPESEANAVIHGMDMTGHADFARRGLEFYLSRCNTAGFITILIDAPGGKVGYTIVGTGEVLWTLGEHYERTRDQEWLRQVAPNVVHICRWIVRQREKTKRLDARGDKVAEYGLMPPGVSADWNRFAYRFFNEAQYCRGLESAGQALADIGDPAAPAILEDVRAYREDIVRAYHSMQAKMPVVPLKDGTWVPADPSILGCYGNVEDFLLGADASRSYVYSVELGAHHLVAHRVIEPRSQDADWMIDYLEDVHFPRTNWVHAADRGDAFDWGGFAKMQPYYCRIAEIHAARDDVQPFIRSYFNVIPALVNLEDLTFWEDMGTNGFATGAWNKTHETGWFLAQTRTMFVTERDDELWLAPFVTRAWLKDGLHVAVRNVPTRFGNVGYTIASHVAQGAIEAVVQLPPRCTAKRVVLRLRHPDGKPILSATVEGQPHADFDPRSETVSLQPTDQTIVVQAKY